ncbi:MAG: hypothetical protein WBL67_18625 [Nitrososphaeraceae archaeon]
MVPIILGLFATSLIIYSLYTGYEITSTTDEITEGKNATTTTVTSREHKIPDSYLIILGLILVILLAPEIRMAKVGPVEFELARDPLPINI